MKTAKYFILFVLVLSVGACSFFGTSSKGRISPADSKSAVEESTAEKFIGNLFWPLASKKLSSPYGPRKGSFHDGIDIAAPYVERVYAAHGGVVIRQDQKFRGYGKLLVVQGDEIVTFYGHLDDYVVLIGDRIEKGQVIGFVGSTGRSTGPHLHFETRIRSDSNTWVPVDPRVFF